MATIDAIDITSLNFQEGSAPGTPASTQWKLYTKTDGLYVIDDAGTETGPFGAGGGTAGGLTFTAVTRELVYNASTTSSTIARGLTTAISAVPSDAVLATGYIQIHGAASSGNFIIVHHQDADSDIAAIAYGLSSSIPMNVPFACKVQQSSGSKLYYSVTRTTGTLTYSLAVTGYWAPA